MKAQGTQRSYATPRVLIYLLRIYRQAYTRDVLPPFSPFLGLFFFRPGYKREHRTGEQLITSWYTTVYIVLLNFVLGWKGKSVTK